MRLNKYLATYAGISRREADALISDGNVMINDTVASIGDKYTDGDVVMLNGAPIAPHASTTIILNKPAGYVCSRKQQGDTPTIYALLPDRYHKLKTIGRLDANSSGIILLSDDGDLAHRLTHPKFQKQKIYEVTLSEPLQPLHRQMISDFGVMLDDGKSQFALERLHDDDTQWKIYMHEGRNRQIRRTFAALGYHIRILHRSTFGNYKLPDDLLSGSWQLAE